MQPVLNEFISNNNQSLKVIAMDGSTEYGLMKELNVQALPTYILYRNGVEDSRKQGVLSSEELNTWVVSGNEPADSKINMDLSELHQRQKQSNRR